MINSAIAIIKPYAITMVPIVLSKLTLNDELTTVAIKKDELLIVLIIITILYQAVSLVKLIFKKEKEKDIRPPNAGDYIGG